MYRFALLNHKCGTVYFKNVLRQVCKKTNAKFIPVSKPLGDIDCTRFFVQEQIKEKKNRILNLFFRSDEFNELFFFPNSTYQIPDLMKVPDYRAFMMIRDPRDVIVSGYFSHKNSHPLGEWSDLENIRMKLNELSLNDGLLSEIDRGYALNWFKTVGFNNPKIKIVRFEDFVCENFRTVRDIVDFLNISISDDSLLEIVKQNTFERQTQGRSPGVENINHHFRKGISGDWKNYFTPEHCDVFNKKWGDLLINLGYEKDGSWF